MNMKLRFGLVFLASSVLHGVLFWSVPESPLSKHSVVSPATFDGRLRPAVVSVKLLDREHTTPSSEAQTKTLMQPSFKLSNTHAQRQLAVKNVDPGLQVESTLEQQPSPQSLPTSGLPREDSGYPQSADEPEPLVNLSEPVVSQQERALDAVAPCQSIVLPERWTHLKNVWPRKYQVEFGVQQSQGRQQIVVENMKVIGEPFAALDSRIGRAFADCILTRQSDLGHALGLSQGLLKPESGQAYFQTIEFYPSGLNVASKQGT